MTPIFFLCIGFVLAVGWIDLKFDALALPYRNKPGLLPEEVLTRMTSFFGTITGRPIVFLTALTVIVTTLILEIVQATVPAWIAWTSLVLFGAAMTLITVVIVPAARRFGRRDGTLEEQSKIGRALFWWHCTGFSLVSLMALLQIYALWGR